MKSTLLLICTLFIVTIQSYSQSTFNAYSELGVKAGISKPNGYIVDSTQATLFDGTLVGIKYVYVAQRNIGILLEANYNRVGYNNNGYNISFDYLHLPFLTHIVFPIGKLGIKINLGTYGLVYLNKDENVHLQRDFLYGLSGGLGASYSFSKFIFEVETRYYFNLPSSHLEDESMRGRWGEVSLVLCRRFFSKKK